MVKLKSVQPKLSHYSQLPFPQSDLFRHENQLENCIAERCPEDELADAYESLGLSQLYLGNYSEAASNLECACVVQSNIIVDIYNAEHKLRLKFWVITIHDTCFDCFMSRDYVLI